MKLQSLFIMQILSVLEDFGHFLPFLLIHFLLKLLLQIFKILELVLYLLLIIFLNEQMFGGLVSRVRTDASFVGTVGHMGAPSTLIEALLHRARALDVNRGL